MITIVLVRDIQLRDGEGHLTGMTKLIGTEINPLSKKLKTNARIDAINTGVKDPVTVDALIRQIESPLMERVMKVRVLSRFELLS